MIKSDCNQLPIHFLTIVLNGQPFIRYHAKVFEQLPFKWHWHIVEGVATIKHCDKWSLKTGGHIIDEMHCNGRSNDGTTEYLDHLVKEYPNHISLYRKPLKEFWEGRIEMVNAPIPNIQESCLLWQIDVDELWTLEQIRAVRQLFLENPTKTAAYYWCSFFVGSNLIVSTRNCYSQNPKLEWLRTWRFTPGMHWKTHSPPRLFETTGNGETRDVAEVNPFWQEETERHGLVFQHFAYVTSEQVFFKEHCYGYEGALTGWKRLQQQCSFPTKLKDYFPWVQDNTLVDTTKTCGVFPIAQKDSENGEWSFRYSSTEDLEAPVEIDRSSPHILIDSVVFQFFQTNGSKQAQFWSSFLEYCADSSLNPHFTVLDRSGTCPRIEGIRYQSIPHYESGKSGIDSLRLQQICEKNHVDLFVSTYHTIPVTTPSTLVLIESDPDQESQFVSEQDKTYSSLYASATVATSKDVLAAYRDRFPNLSQDFLKIIDVYPELNHEFSKKTVWIMEELIEIAKKTQACNISSVNPLWTEIKRMQSQLQQAQTSSNYELQYQLQKAKKIIMAMETSSFWKLRSVWLRIKKRLGLSSHDWWK